MKNNKILPMEENTGNFEKICDRKRFPAEKTISGGAAHENPLNYVAVLAEGAPPGAKFNRFT